MDINFTKDLSIESNQPKSDNDLKEYIINYVGEKKDPEDDQVTISMIVDVLSKDFPELVLCLSEENWIRGYQQGLTDVQEGERLYHEELSGKQTEET
jgi:hypothetical protein